LEEVKMKKQETLRICAVVSFVLSLVAIAPFLYATIFNMPVPYDLVYIGVCTIPAWNILTFVFYELSRKTGNRNRKQCKSQNYTT
jgi:uncharacterized membrane protein